jgi:hypothetical protein
MRARVAGLASRLPSGSAKNGHFGRIRDLRLQGAKGFPADAA